MNNASLIEQVKIQFGVCARNFRNQKRWSVLISTFLMPLMIILVTGSDVFSAYAATKKGAFAIICACIWIGLFNSIQNICKERATIGHEYREGLNLYSYVLAQMAFETILSALEAIIVSGIVIIRYAGNIHGFFPAVGILISIFLIIVTSDSLGLLVSAIVRRPDQAMTVMPFLLIMQLVFAGLIFELNGIADTIGNFTISRWGLDAIMDISGLEDSTWKFWVETEAGSPFPVCWLVLLAFLLFNILLASNLLKLVKHDKR